MTPQELENNFLKLIDEVIHAGVTDIHLWSGNFPYVRAINRNVEPAEKFGRLTYEDMMHLISFMSPLITQEKIKTTEKGINFIYEYQWTRFRANVSKNSEGVAVAMRTIKKNTPTAEWVGLTPNILRLLHEDRWLILVTGWTGSGKTTTVMAMLDYLNKNTSKHIITVEDPVEYIVKNDKSLIHQKQVWRDVVTFEQAIRDAMREDPDVIVVWEMRDQETISAVLTLAETWHLVISTLHTNDVVQAFDRLIYAFPATMQSQIRIQLALVLAAVVGQIILPRKDNSWNLVAREVFINNSTSRNIIMDWNISHLYGVMETWRQDGQVMMQHALIDLHKQWSISWRTLMQHIKDPIVLKEYLENLRDNEWIEKIS